MTSASVVYVIGGTSLAVVKIGTSTDPHARLRQLQRGAPAQLELLWSTPGDGELEKRLHTRFGPLRTHGEWFDLTSLGEPVDVVKEGVRAIQAGSRGVVGGGPCHAPEICRGDCLCYLLAAPESHSTL